MVTICGICAVSRADRSSIPNINLFMRHGSYTIEKRGPHATGFGWVDGSGASWYWKTPGKATEVAHRIDLSGARTAIGHTRYATQGKPEKNENNHPLIEDNILLVHNGIVDNDDWVFAQLDTPRTNEVDSQAIAALLAYPDEFGAKGPADVLEDNFQGDAAIAWLDNVNPEMLHLARCNGRPMFIGYTKKHDLVMASTDEALVFWSRLSGVTIDDIDEIPEGTYLQVVKGEIVNMECFKPYVPPKKSYGTGTNYTQTSKSEWTKDGWKPKKDDEKEATVTVIGPKKDDEPAEQLALPRGEPTTVGDWIERDRVIYEEFPFDDEKAMEFVEKLGGNWEFQEWTEEKLAEEMADDWLCRREDFESQFAFDAVLREYAKHLAQTAEWDDYLAMQAWIKSEPIDEEVTV